MKALLNPRYLVSALLCVLIAGFAATIGWETDWGRNLYQPVRLPKTQATKLALTAFQPEFTLPPLDQSFTEILLRPLFVATRRPPPPPPPPAPIIPPKPTMRKGQFLLLGVILTKDKNVALLREVATGKVSRVEQGKEINGIRVEKLEAEKVTFKQWDDTEEVILKIQAMPKPPPLPVTPVGVPGQPVQPGAVPGAGPVAPQGIISRRRGLSP